MNLTTKKKGVISNGVLPMKTSHYL